jgi:hypothetical protein
MSLKELTSEMYTFYKITGGSWRRSNVPGRPARLPIEAAVAAYPNPSPPLFKAYISTITEEETTIYPNPLPTLFKT